MAAKMIVEKPKSVYKPMCTCSLVAGGHFSSECAPIRRSEAAKKHREYLQRQEQNLADKKVREEKKAKAEADWDRRQGQKASDRADREHRLSSIERRLQAKQNIRDVAVEKRFPESTSASTAASEAGEDDWKAPAPGVEDLWNDAPAAQKPADAPVGKKPLFTFSMDEWKELQKVKKLLREIDAIDGMQLEGKKLYQNQLAKQQRRTELENCLVMVKDRAGCARPNLL